MALALFGMEPILFQPPPFAREGSDEMAQFLDRFNSVFSYYAGGIAAGALIVVAAAAILYSAFSVARYLDRYFRSTP